jgi:hypothetical protein
MQERSTHTPANVEVRGWRDGRVVARRVCESEQEARALVEQWSEQDFTRVEIDDLSVEHGSGEILEPDLEIEASESDDRRTP